MITKAAIVQCTLAKLRVYRVSYSGHTCIIFLVAMIGDGSARRGCRGPEFKSRTGLKDFSSTCNGIVDLFKPST